MATTLSDIRSTPGLDDYLDALEERLARTVATHPGLVAAVGNEALAELLGSCGFAGVRFRRFAGGIVALHVGEAG